MPSILNPLSPITNLRICRGVPFDSTYTDTIKFGSASAQSSFFAGKTKYSYANLTPIKIQNAIRVPVDADHLYDCNYVAFNNANFGSKWFYAFITDIKYVNPNTSEIRVELDVMQTWMFDYTIKECYVVREHTNSDEYGEHTLLEPLEIGEYVNEFAQRSGHLDDYRAVIMYAPNDSIGDGMVGGLFTGLTYMSTPLSTAGAGAMLDLLNTLINSNRADSVVATYIMPADFYTTDADCKTYDIFVPKQVESLGTYKPRNKKLLCYPYNMLSVDNSMGTVKNYRWEYFTNAPSSGAPFTMGCPMGTNPEVILYPRSYGNQNMDVADSMTISGFPQFAYVIDTYRAWAAQSGNTFALSALSNVLGLGMSTATGNVSGAISNTMGIANNVASFVEHASQANTSRGSQGSNAAVAMKRKDFYFSQRHIREDYAAVLDDYFDMYGYICNQVKVPNITGRPSWNYVKTDGAKIVGSIPFNDIEVIKANFDRGITFWHGDYVGDYSRNNGV